MIRLVYRLVLSVASVLGAVYVAAHSPVQSWLTLFLLLVGWLLSLWWGAIRNGSRRRASPDTHRVGMDSRLPFIRLNGRRNRGRVSLDAGAVNGSVRRSEYLERSSGGFGGSVLHLRNVSVHAPRSRRIKTRRR